MTHPNHQTNGASLEDCHTNFFALTDLCGIKWRKLVGSESVSAVEALDDPVLRSYSQCLANDILCVWRRVSGGGGSSSTGTGGLYDLGGPTIHTQHTTSTAAAATATNPPLSLHAAKELWIFWYGEEPDLSELVAPELILPDAEQGSWESGLSYECRSLLFKALHNLIERCLLSRDFVRLGKWFVQPYEGPRKNIGPSTTHLSFSFAFFVHGESTVCASVDVRQHPPVRRLGKQHILQAQTSTNGLPVILAPFGLSASLTGGSSKPDTPTRVLDDWSHFYPVEQPLGPPSCVEVVVGGVKLRYPACYVLLTDMDEPAGPGAAEEVPPPPALQGPAGLLPERVWQDAVLGGPAKQPGEWEFVEPTRRTQCTCSKCRKVVGPGKAGGRTKGARRVPFHRRTPPPPSHTNPHTPHHANNTDNRYHQGACTPQGGPPSYPRTQDSLTVPSVGSPPSVAPSPQPASVPAGGEAPAPTPPVPSNTAGVTPPPAGAAGPPDQNTTPDQGGAQSPAGAQGAQSPLPAVKTEPGLLKRPVLSMKEYEDVMLEEEQTLDLLYDYSTLDAWLNHPVKRFKPDARENKLKHKHGDIYSLYGTPNGTPSNEPPTLNGSTQHFIKQEIKQEPFPLELEATQTVLTGGKRPGDPYEFEEEGASGVQLDFKRQAVKEENKEIKKCPAGNLFTSEGLQPSYKDLDQIFDNSDDTSSDEALQVQTPPGSNKSLTEDTSKRICAGGPGILRPEELSKMFPTPPSLEHPVASPQLELSAEDIKAEYPQLGSPLEEHIEDWSFVFKPNLLCKMVGSSKYAPLTNLPSSSLPPLQVPSNLVYKPSWVDKPRPATTTEVSQVVPQPPSNVSGAPVTFPQSPMHSFRAPPPPYELSSPATSNASSYLNKNLNSVEPMLPQPNIKTPEANSLLVNLLLGDTSLNIFRDHNFDSCTLCVCNAGPKCVGNIKGADAQLYLSSGGVERGPPVAQPQPSSPFPGMYGMLSPPQHDEDNIRCSCGFSAVVNRKLSHRSGLFYEDEMEITGIAEDPSDRKKGSLFSFFKLENGIDRDIVDAIPQSILELVREQCVMLQNTSNSLYRASKLYRGQNLPPYSTTINILEFSDSNEVTSLALDSSRLIDTQIMCKLEHAAHAKSTLCVHKWPFLRASGPTSHQDIVRVMKALQPLLQEAIQKKCTTRLWEAPYTVKGPLTWRQFHRLAGRGTDDRCEPQPIPSLIVGHDKDWLSLSPYALQFWDRLLLEPYSYSRDVAYIVVAPDNEAILPRVRSFFKELSTAYEVCRLGRHSPITKVLRDGILRVGKNAKTKLANEPIEEWFGMLGEGDTTDMIKLYAQACKHHLAPHLLQVPMDKTLLDPPDLDKSVGAAPSPMPPPSTPDQAPSTPKQDSSTSSSGDSSSALDISAQAEQRIPALTQVLSDASLHDEDEGQAPSVVVYLVEPFTTGSDHQDLQRLACVALLRCFQGVLQSVPDHIRTNISVQIISQESIVELGRARERNRQSDHMRALALSIFSQCRRLLVHSSNVKSLTGFGTAAMADLFLKSKDEKNRAAYKMYTPPYVLAPLKERAESAESFGQASTEQCSVLYLSYCLSEDQSLILAVATDERGEICETVTINIDVPNRSRRKKASARRIGLQKLMDFIVGVMSQSVQPWRLVVGRVGRIGHGELKGWSWLLSRKSLLKASKHLKEICTQCSLMYPQNVPCIMSACLVSLEPDSTLRLMPDQFTPDERFSQVSVNSQLSTPQDVTCTHILVFPTSATTQSSQTAFQETHINGPDLGDDELFNALNDDMPEGIDGMNDFNDIFSVWPEPGQGGQSPTGSPRKEENSPARQSPFPCVARGSESSEEVGTLLQQPLALGYLVSTAPMGRMPRWFWASCPHLEGVCPAFLKNALHLHSPAIQQSSDDLLQQAAVTSHPLDSQYTTDVLRFVLEGYNALSWLALDSNTQDRLSCLPVHIQVLIQLYHLTASLL